MHAMPTMRVCYPPVRFGDPQFVVPARRVELKPFEGQKRKYTGTIRFPQLIVKKSTICNAGNGVFLCEDVRAGQVLSMYPKNIVSEKEAKKRKGKVLNIIGNQQTNSKLFSIFLQGNRHIRANHAACCFLDSKPSHTWTLDRFRRNHEVAGMANSSPFPNAEFVDVGFDTILVAKVDLNKNTELLPKYTW